MVDLFQGSYLSRVKTPRFCCVPICTTQGVRYPHEFAFLVLHVEIVILEGQEHSLQPFRRAMYRFDETALIKRFMIGFYVNGFSAEDILIEFACCPENR